MNEDVAKLLKNCGYPLRQQRRSAMDMDSAMCREQAAYCALLLSKSLAPTRRAQLEREREDWLVLAHRQDTWRAVRQEEKRLIGA